MIDFWQSGENKNRLSLAFVATAMGFLLTLQFRTTLVQKESLPFRRLEELSTRLLDTEKERDELRNELKRLNDEREKLTVVLPPQLEMAAGTVALYGPGIIATIDDSRRVAKAGENQNLYIIHDEDILKVINELRAAGAEAIALNGQRLTANSEIRCAGPTLSVNNVRSAPPYEIIAIGDPKTLEHALTMRGGVIDTLKVWGIQLALRQERQVTIPAYSGPSPFHNAALKPREKIAVLPETNITANATSVSAKPR